VLNLYAMMCLSANVKAIKKVMEVGLNESHVLLCIHKDTERLMIHEQIKQQYMLLTRCMFIDNDPIAPGIVQKNRCYIWEKLVPPKVDEENKYDLNAEEEDANMIENDFYQGKAKDKLTQMDDPNNSMIVLRYEQESKDLALIRMIKKNVTWFLLEGPEGTEKFFYRHQQRKFHAKQLKIKIRSLKVYLDTIYALIDQDCVDPVFIENCKLVCQCALIGASHYSDKQEEKIPEYIRTNWVYILTWLAKDICLTSHNDSRSMQNAVKNVECKVLEIFEKLTCYRLNLQIQTFLQQFRMF